MGQKNQMSTALKAPAILLLVNQDPKNFQEKLFLLLEDINPDIVHFHHFLHIGVDTIKAIKITLPP